MSALPYELLLEFQKQNPSYKVKWKEYPDRQAEWFLQEDQFELGLFVLGNQIFDNSFHITPLFTKKIVLLVYEGHPLYRRETIDFKELKDEPIIVEGDDFWIYDLFRRKCISHGFFPNIIAETGDISFCHKLCSMEQGLGLSVDFVADFIQTPNIRKVYFDDPDFFWPVGLVRRKNTALSEAGRIFCQFLQLKFGVQ